MSPEPAAPRARTEGRIRERSERSPFAESVTAPVARRIRLDQTAGWPVIGASVVALIWANVLWPSTYEAVWTTEVSLSVGPWTLSGALREVVDVVLLPFFFLVVGIEIREELTTGHLAGRGRAWLPLLAALGGMAVPVAVYLSLAWGTPYRGGFGVPVATDVAFVLALLMMLGDRAPSALKAFLLAFAAADDVGGVLVIALFYGHGFSGYWLAAALTVAIASAVLLRLRPQVTWAYVGVAVALWTTTALSGVHVTIAGVALGLMIPQRPLFTPGEVAERARRLAGQLSDDAPGRRDLLLGRLEELATRSESPAAKVVRVLRPTVSYFVLPIFGLAMAGTSLHPEAWGGLTEHAGAMAVAAGLLVGKPLGVLGLTWLGVRLGLTRLPEELGWWHIVGAAALSSIGFTVSLFIAKLAFPAPNLEVVKLAILVSSGIGAVAGLGILSAAGRSRDATHGP